MASHSARAVLRPQCDLSPFGGRTGGLVGCRRALPGQSFQPSPLGSPLGPSAHRGSGAGSNVAGMSGAFRGLDLRRDRGQQCLGGAFGPKNSGSGAHFRVGASVGPESRGSMVGRSGRDFARFPRRCRFTRSGGRTFAARGCRRGRAHGCQQRNGSDPALAAGAGIVPRGGGSVRL